MKKIKARYLKKEESLRKILGDGKSLKNLKVEEKIRDEINELTAQMQEKRKQIIKKSKNKLDKINKKHEKLIQKATNEPVTMKEFGDHVSSLHKKEEKKKEKPQCND